MLCEKKASDMNCHTFFYSSKREAIFTMEFENTKLEIIYTKKNKMFIPPSMIYTRFYFDKNSTTYFHLPELLGYLEEYDFRACYFPYIENIYRLNACLLSLFDLIDEYLEMFQSLDFIQINQLIRKQSQFLTKEFNEDENEESLDFERRFYERFYYLNRFSVFEGYYSFLRDDYSLAIKQYKKLAKKDTLMEYEKQLIETMENNHIYDAISKECFALDDIQPYLETSKKNGKNLLMCMLVVFIPSVFILIGIMFGMRFLFSNGCLIYCGAQWWWGIMCAFLPAIFGGVAFRREIMKFLKIENIIQALDFDDILNSEFTNQFAMGSFLLSCLVSIFFVFVLTSENVSFYDDYLKMPNGFIHRDIYQYSEIEKIYHIDARYNDFGYRIERESYILLFDNQEYLDLDGYASINVCEEEILPLLNIDVEQINSEKELEDIKE